MKHDNETTNEVIKITTKMMIKPMKMRHLRLNKDQQQCIAIILSEGHLR